MFGKSFALWVVFFGLEIFNFGLNKLRHMVIGVISYQVLKDKDEPALKTVLELLKKHSYYPEWVKTMDAENILEADRDLFLLMSAARWPDDIRDDKNENRSKWHYISYPLKFGNDDSVQIFPPDNDNIE